MSERAERKVLLRQQAYERHYLMKEKRSEEYESLEEVFDRATLLTVYRLMNQGIIHTLHGVVSAGKESRVYWAIDATRRDLAVKIFLTGSAEFRSGRLQYLQGDPRFQGPIRGTRNITRLWASKEFKNLQVARNAGVSVPKPVKVQENVLVMEFIGEDGVPAPLLKERPVHRPGRLYSNILQGIRSLYKKAELVHADLSEYNIMISDGRPILFDFGQAVSVQHPNSSNFLRRDLKNLNSFFSRLDVKVKELKQLERWIVDGETHSPDDDDTA